MLGKYYVEFGQKGVEGVEKAVDGIGAKLKKADAEAAPLAKGIGQKIVEGIGGALSRVGEQFAALGRAAQLPFALATGAVLGFVRAGLAGTTAGEALALRFQLLNREIASLFLPIIERVIGALDRAVNWFKSLDGATQEAIGRTVALSVALLGAAVILPRLIAGVEGVAGAFVLLRANPIVAVVAALAALLLFTESGREAIAGIGEAFRPVVAAVGELWRAFQPIIDALASVIPPLVQALQPVFEGLAAAITVVVNALTAVVNGLRAAINWVIDRINDVRRFFGQSEIARIAEPREREERRREGGRDRHELANATRGPESLQASFTRFQTAALRTGSTAPERTAAATERSAELLTGIAAGVSAAALEPPSVT